MTENPDRIERTLELLLYAPLGVGLFLKESAPAFVDMFVSRGRAEIDRRHESVQQRVTTARSLGQVALAFGPPIVRERVERTVADARQRAEGLFGSPAADSAPPPAPAPVPAATVAPPPPAAPPTPTTTTTGWEASPAPVAPVAPPAPPAATHYAAPVTPPAPTASDYPISSNGGSDAGAELPIPGYDALSASQVVERLLGLSVRELEAVHAYETAHRQRRTILGKIEQLIG